MRDCAYGVGRRAGSSVFFFSSRRRHTSYIGDWSSDVCSSDLGYMAEKLGRVPIAGSTIDLQGWSITSERPIGRRRRISSVIIERPEQEIDEHE